MTVDVKMPSFDQLAVFGCITSTSDAPKPALKAASAMREQQAVVEDGGWVPCLLQLPSGDASPLAHESQPG